MSAEDWKESRSCPECGNEVPPENYEYVEGGDKVRYDCSVCPEPVFRDSKTKNLHERIRNRDSPVIQEEKERDALRESDTNLLMVDESAEPNQCVTPGCENEENLERIEYEDGGKSGKLCEECRNRNS